jgi:hypothetical protein
MILSKKISILGVFLISVLIGYAQDTTNVLFIGNSFTAANNLTLLFQKLAANANIPVYVGEYSPGGISVGDYSQGTSAHCCNPVVFNLIRSKSWDFVVIQDNQGRFCLNYGVFSSSSNVIGGHLIIQDSVLANNPCANMIWFAGWGFQGPYPPYSTSGAQMIEKIFANYTFLNDTSKQIIAPIGPSWLVSMNNYPSLNLWSADSTHPSLEGSYLTACVLFATIFKQNPSNLTFTGGINSTDAQNLRNIVFPKVIDSLYVCNLDLFSPGIYLIIDTLFTDTGYSSYNWYKGDSLVQTTYVNYYKIVSNDIYSVGCVDSNGCERKSFGKNTMNTSTNNLYNKSEVFVYPVPTDNLLNITFTKTVPYININIANIQGQILLSKIIFDIREGNSVSLELVDLPVGIYIMQLSSNNFNKFSKIIVQK